MLNCARDTPRLLQTSLIRRSQATRAHAQSIFLPNWLSNPNFFKKVTKIEELSKQYLMNTTTLKSVFKAVYGMPIASYMKEYRMKLASNMLLQEDKSISEIAAAVGYKSQSKFTSAFRDIFQILPTAYQKLYRNQ